jgi:Domain of unknown function (DUF4331)
LRHSGTRLRNRTIATIGSVALVAGLFASLAPTASFASSHREAPLTAADPQIDGTDLYTFVSPDRPNTVTFISSWDPFEEPAGGPNFFPWAEGVHYDINIDNNGDAKPDVTYRWVFTNHGDPNTFLYNNGPVTQLDPPDPNLTFYQTYDLQKVVGNNVTTLVHDAMAVPDDVGTGSMPDYRGNLFDAGSYPFGSAPSFTWAGQSDDPFFLDLRVFDLLYGGDLSETGDDTLTGFNVNTLALQVRMKNVALKHKPDVNPIIGVWTTASRKSMRVENGDGTQTFSGPNVQVSRLGNPLVNEVVIPRGKKDLFNASQPKNDGQFLGYVHDDPELPEVVHAVYPSIPVPDSDNGTAGVQRDDLVQVFLTGINGLNQPPNVTPSEELRLNMSIPPCEPGSCNDYSDLGVIGGDNAGFPNGRRLSDDILDASLQVVEGELIGNPNDLGDGVNANDVPFNEEFPYVAYPHPGSAADPHS